MREATTKTTPSAQRLKVKSTKLNAGTPPVEAPVEAREAEAVSVDEDGQMCLWRVNEAPHRQEGSI